MMMNKKELHSFHIPVMGLAYTVDTPLRVAHYGIDSVISIVDDELLEKMRAFFCRQYGLAYTEISTKMTDYRANRITNYLNLMNDLVKQKFSWFCNQLQTNKEELDKFIAMLPKTSEIRKGLLELPHFSAEKAKKFIEEHLSPGAIDVNIMTKVDKTNYLSNVALPQEYNDAHAALRGFANSNLNSSLVLSAGMNPSLYSYAATFKDFILRDIKASGKKIVLKVSDFRSAMVQGCFLAKKGIWVSEFRIESGLNCGGHSFAANGLLLGPILEEFKQKKDELIESMRSLLLKNRDEKEMNDFSFNVRITVQGGVGTSEEHQFLLDHYAIDAVGWGSPFLLVPEATAVDKETRNLLAKSSPNELYRSNLSPLGVPFNAIKGMSNDFYKSDRISKGKPGSSCPKKLLALHQEFGENGICTASRKYQQKKIAEIENLNLNGNESFNYCNTIVEKACLCVGLANPVYIEKGIAIKGEEQGVVICPGPNIAYFNKEVSLAEMVGHIYGYLSIMNDASRPHMFIKELELNIDCLKKEIEAETMLGNIKTKQWQLFKDNLLAGISYYEVLFTELLYKNNDDIQNKLNYYKNEVSCIDVK